MSLNNMIKLVVVTVLWLSLAQIQRSQAGDACDCLVPYERIGCFNDVKKNRALPHYIMNDRDPKLPNYSGQKTRWWEWDIYLPQLICRCAEKAKRSGMKYFGIQFFSECWAGDENAQFDKHLEGDKCFDTVFGSCGKVAKHCAGGKNHNMVYKLPEPTCDEKFERVGCFKDRRNRRTLPDQALTSRDPSNVARYTGSPIDWANFDLFLPDFACKCAAQARVRKHDVFAIQYWGECWTGDSASLEYYSFGVSRRCFNRCFKPCRNFDRICTGAGFTNFVYRTETVSDNGDVVDCHYKFQYKHCHLGKTALPILLVDEYNPTSPKFDGHVHQDEDWGNRFKEFLCSCSMAAKEKNMQFFGATAQGLCYGGTTTTFNDGGQCEKPDNNPCSAGDMCGGRDSMDSLGIYEVL